VKWEVDDEGFGMHACRDGERTYIGTVGPKVANSSILQIPESKSARLSENDFIDQVSKALAKGQNLRVLSCFDRIGYPLVPPNNVLTSELEETQDLYNLLTNSGSSLFHDLIDYSICRLASCGQIQICFMVVHFLSFVSR